MTGGVGAAGRYRGRYQPSQPVGDILYITGLEMTRVETDAVPHTRPSRNPPSSPVQFDKAGQTTTTSAAPPVLANASSNF